MCPPLNGRTDLRSDTVTRPSAAMRAAMAEAEVGDDVYGEDPTVNRLQETAAALLGKEAALLVPSGTMGNQASIRSLTRPGEVVVTAVDAHILMYESGAASALSGVQIQTVGDGSSGSFTGTDVRVYDADGPELAFQRLSWVNDVSAQLRVSVPSIAGGGVEQPEGEAEQEERRRGDETDGPCIVRAEDPPGEGVEARHAGHGDEQSQGEGDAAERGFHDGGNASDGGQRQPDAHREREPEPDEELRQLAAPAPGEQQADTHQRAHQRQRRDR